MTNQEETRPNRLHRFPRVSIRGLFVILFVCCFVLTRFYPRVASSVTVDVGAKNQEIATVACSIATSPEVFVHATNNCSDIELMSSAPLNWLRKNIRADVGASNEIRISLVGSPATYMRHERIVETVAKEFIILIQTTNLYSNPNLFTGSTPAIVDRTSKKTMVR